MLQVFLILQKRSEEKDLLKHIGNFCEPRFVRANIHSGKNSISLKEALYLFVYNSQPSIIYTCNMLLFKFVASLLVIEFSLTSVYIMLKAILIYITYIDILIFAFLFCIS